MKNTLENDIEKFLSFWDCKQHVSFMKDVIPIIELYDVEESEDWVEKQVGKEDLKNVRLIRTVYLVSKFLSCHCDRLIATNARFKNLWRRIESHGLEFNSD